MKKVIFITTSIFVLLFMSMFILMPKKEFSENENRYLEEFPTFSFSALSDGTYIGDIQTYITDHFPFRDFFVGLKTNFEKALGKKVINDVYLGLDEYKLTKYNKLKDTYTLIDKLNNFATNNEDKKISLMLVPTSITIYNEKLPNNAITDSELEVINEIYSQVKISTIDVYDALKKASNTTQVFYRTDHHWTTYGAYFAYLNYCEVNNMNPLTIDDFNIEKVSDEFYGTLYSKTNDYNVKPDDIYVFETETEYEVNYDNITITDTFYTYDYLETKDKYSLFLDNNHALITITNLNAINDKEILILKDSFANAFIPFLAEHYHKVHVVDLRFNLNSMTTYIDENNNIDEILILYNINSLDETSSIYNIR